MNRWIKWQKLDMTIPSILGIRGAASPTPYTSPKSSVDFYVRKKSDHKNKKNKL